MRLKAEVALNPLRYHLSDEAKKRLGWLYVLYHECSGNATQASRKIGLSREWLSKLKSLFEKHQRDPRCLEPKSKAPHDTSNRERISWETENGILEVRRDYGWGKENIAVVLKRDYGLIVGSSTVNRYLHKHSKINPELSERNEKAWAEKKLREELGTGKPLAVKYRPPSRLKDYAPGALIEKDMKLAPTIGKKPIESDQRYHIKNHFNYQHTFLDSFTRIRGLELSEEPDSLAANLAYERVKQRLPFEVASVNTDSGGENGKDFRRTLISDEIIQFYSRAGTPTDNPRAERSHLTDEKEFYQRGNSHQPFEKQKEALAKWEYIYNYIRPNQALGNLTPMEFYQLWQADPEKAYAIKDKYQAYLAKQRKRLANSRRIKNKEQIEKLMNFIDAKLSQKKTIKVDLNPYKLELIKCELCSWT